MQASSNPSEEYGGEEEDYAQVLCNVSNFVI